MGQPRRSGSPRRCRWSSARTPRTAGPSSCGRWHRCRSKVGRRSRSSSAWITIHALLERCRLHWADELDPPSAPVVVIANKYRRSARFRPQFGGRDRPRRHRGLLGRRRLGRPGLAGAARVALRHGVRGRRRRSSNARVRSGPARLVPSGVRLGVRVRLCRAFPRRRPRSRGSSEPTCRCAGRRSAEIGGFHSDNHDDMDMCHRLMHQRPAEQVRLRAGGPGAPLRSGGADDLELFLAALLLRQQGEGRGLPADGGRGQSVGRPRIRGPRPVAGRVQGSARRGPRRPVGRGEGRIHRGRSRLSRAAGPWPECGGAAGPDARRPQRGRRARAARPGAPPVGGRAAGTPGDGPSGAEQDHRGKAGRQAWSQTR